MRQRGLDPTTVCRSRKLLGSDQSLRSRRSLSNRARRRRTTGDRCSNACWNRPGSSDRRFDVICVHAFSRFYRNGAEMELTIRKLRKSGVEVVSVTQPTGDDPSQQLMRQIIGIFDEYTSRENGKNVIRAMRESAKQGFWNGATPPLGYRIIEAERRGSKIKNRLDVDPVEAELVRLIFRLYVEGDGKSGHLGSRKSPSGSTGRGTARGEALPLVSVLSTAFSQTAVTPPANGPMGSGTRELGVFTIRPRSWKSTSRPSSRVTCSRRSRQGSLRITPRSLRRGS